MDNEELKKYVKEAKNGSAEAFEKLYRLTYREAFTLACSLVDDKNNAEDIVHDVYIKVLINLPKLQNEASFKSWFKRIVTNTSKDFLIKKKPDLFSSYDSYDSFEEDFDQRLVDIQSLEQPLTSDAETEEASKRIISAIGKLPEEQRVCVIMHYYSEMKVDEIAKVLGVSRNTVLSRLSYARKKLKKELDDDNKNDFFGIALFPYVQSIEISPEAMAVEASGELLTELLATAEAETLFAVSGAGIIAKIAGLTLFQKVILVASAFAVIGGISAIIIGNQLSGDGTLINTENTELTAQAYTDLSVNKEKSITYSGGKLLLNLNGSLYFSENGGVYKASGNIAKAERITAGIANNFVTDGKYIYFISDGLIYQYDAEESRIIQSAKAGGEYIAFDGEDLYTVSVNHKKIYNITASLEEENAQDIEGNHISFFNNSLTYYKQSDMYFAYFSNGKLNEKKVIDGKPLKGMKLNSQIADGNVYYPDFDSDETGKINVSTTDGTALYKIKLKRGYIDFCVCKDEVLYSATGGGLYVADLNGENDRYISNGDYSFTAYSEPFVLCYNAKNNTSVLLNVENGELTLLANGYVKEFEYASNTVFYKLNDDNYIKEL